MMGVLIYAVAPLVTSQASVGIAQACSNALD